MSLNARALAIKVAEAAWDKKAFDLKILFVKDQLQIADYFVLCSGRSDRQVIAICERIKELLAESGETPVAVDGQRWGRWICMDYGDVLVHVFFETLRGFYDLDSLWGDAPRLELAEPEWVREAAAARAATEY